MNETPRELVIRLLRDAREHLDQAESHLEGEKIDIWKASFALTEVEAFASSARSIIGKVSQDALRTALDRKTDA